MKRAVQTDFIQINISMKKVFRFGFFPFFSQYQLQISSDTFLRAVYCKISFFRCLRFFNAFFSSFLRKRVKEESFYVWENLDFFI